MKEGKPPAKRRATAEDLAIGQKLRALRLDRGLSQGDLAGETEVRAGHARKGGGAGRTDISGQT